MSDAELIALLREEPERGCEMLLKLYTGLVLSICRKRLGGICTDEDIEELVSDILFAIWQRREQLSEKRGSVRALLITMTNRRCIDLYRAGAKKREPAVQLDDLAEILPAEQPSPEEQLARAESRNTLLCAVRQLKPEDAALIIRKYYYDETAAEIAADLGLRTGTVEMRLSRARKKLKEILGGDQDDG